MGEVEYGEGQDEEVRMKKSLVVILLPLLLFSQDWYRYYKLGKSKMLEGSWSLAASYFKKALALNPEDGKTHVNGKEVDYYPHRELGVCYYLMGKYEEALKELETSMSMSPSSRAEMYLKKLEKKGYKSSTRSAPPTSSTPSGPVQIGERLKIAVLPFETKGMESDLGEIVLDKMITTLVETERFEVMERAQLEKILEEQKLGLSGILDPSTAARIGKGIGVDAIMTGSVAKSGLGVSIDARLIDTETASIITSRDAYAPSKSVEKIKRALKEIVDEIVDDLPVLSGYVVSVEDTTIYVDIGSLKGIKKGRKLVVYREGEPIKNPITGEVMGHKIDVLGEAVVLEVQPKLSICAMYKRKGGLPQPGDKVITK
ncbi:hypothetical protein DRQ18_03295 [bacterium]|nr:MAG: hypothetical protein DRQ18_03295 [bacterium]